MPYPDSVAEELILVEGVAETDRFPAAPLDEVIESGPVDRGAVAEMETEVRILVPETVVFEELAIVVLFAE